MTTPRDLAIVVFDESSRIPVEQGDLSLALAGAELIDLLEAQAVGLDGDHIVPGNQPEPADRLLDEAGSLLARQTPYESVGDWLWRRGRGLSGVYLADLEAEGQLTRQRVRHWMRFRAGRLVLAESPARREAAARWASQEPVLVALAAALGIRDEQPKPSPGAIDNAVAAVLVAVENAVRQLAFERQRRDIEDAAYDNIWRGGI